ncbi:MAG: sugar nucleotide-binding protein [Candidatus Peregrinibacteria bacterium]
MKILLFGPRGYLGQKFLSLYPDAAVPSVDIADPIAVASALDEYKPDIVINAAGKTGVPNVDWCEDHKMETLRSNVTGPLVLLEECGKRGIYWVHLSSGCIYSNSPARDASRGLRKEKDKKAKGQEGNMDVGWTEEDEPNFSGSFYSRSKAWCEALIREFPVLILRLRMPFDSVPHPRNLITKLAKYSRVNELTNSITNLDDFLLVASQLIDKRKTGIYNVVNPGGMSPLRVMELYKEIVNPAHVFERLPEEALSSVSKAARSNCILSVQKLAGEGIAIRHVEEAVRSTLEEMRSMA